MIVGAVMSKDRAAAVATTLVAIFVARLRDSATRDAIAAVLREEFESHREEEIDPCLPHQHQWNSYRGK
jgi:hypothetical protein